MVRSVFRIIGTRVISLTSWIYSPPSSRRVKNFIYFSLALSLDSTGSAVGIFESECVRWRLPAAEIEFFVGDGGTLWVGRSAASDTPATLSATSDISSSSSKGVLVLLGLAY